MVEFLSAITFRRFRSFRSSDRPLKRESLTSVVHWNFPQNNPRKVLTFRVQSVESSNFPPLLPCITEPNKKNLKIPGRSSGTYEVVDSWKNWDPKISNYSPFHAEKRNKRNDLSCFAKWFANAFSQSPLDCSILFRIRDNRGCCFSKMLSDNCDEIVGIAWAKKVTIIAIITSNRKR